MTRYLWILCSLLMCAGYAHAETMYVNDLIRITFRRGPSVEHKVIDTLVSGQKAEIIGQNGAYVHIHLPDGRDGWVLAQYLTPDAPAQIRLEQLNLKCKNQVEKCSELTASNEALTQENERLKASGDQYQLKIEALNSSFDTLKEESADFLTVQAQYEETMKQLESEKRRNATTDKLLKEHIVHWVLTGGGLVLIGLLIGRLSKGGKQRNYY